MSGLGINIGLRALLSSKAALDTIGHNVSNANTPGFSRQSLHLSNARPLNLRGLQLGHGVQADVVLRTVDELLNGRIVKQVATLGKLESQLTEMTSVEALLGEPGGDGFGSLVDTLFDSLAGLSANTEDLVFRTGVTQSAISLTSRFHQVADEVEQLQSDAQAKARFLAEDVNVKAEKILQLNQEIAKVEVNGAGANDLRDQRDQTLRELARLTDITIREDAQGAVRVLVDGQLLVGAQTFKPMEVDLGDGGEILLKLAGSVAEINPRGGELAGLVSFAGGFANDLRERIDLYARNLVIELNRAHSTGVGLEGGFKVLAGEIVVPDLDGDGDLGDALLRDAGLPFDLQNGELYVQVVDDPTGDMRTHRVEIDPSRMTVRDLLDELSGLPGLSASLDNFGRVTIVSEADTTFHFGRPLNEAPDLDGTLGGGRASATNALAEPFALTPGDTLVLQGSVGTATVTFAANDFLNINAARADELAVVINANPQVQANNLRAVVVGDQVALQTIGAGSSESFQITGGSALGALGYSVGSHSGQDLVVETRLSGEYSGGVNDRWTFEPSGDGVIGTTPDLRMLVRNEAGSIVATLEVGAGYAPGNELTVADGVRVSFTTGQVNASENDVFVADVISDSDTSDALVAFGLNALLVGEDATTIGLRDEIAHDPGLLATSATGAVGDSGTVRDMLVLQTADVDELGGSFGEFYSTLVGGVGFEVSSARSAAEVESTLVLSLEERREAVSGVNVDEELVNMIQFEQAYNAAAQFLQVVNGLQDELLQLI